MAFVLTPRFAPAYQTQACNPFGFCAPSHRPSYRRPVPRPAFPSFVPFLSQVEELLGEIDRETRRAQHQQRQQRKRAFRARFDVHENNEGYQVEGEVPGFEQHNISIEVTDDHTLKIAGSTESVAEPQPSAASTSPSPEPEIVEADTEKDAEMDGITLNEPETIHSDASSQRSYQATVEDDFEDLGAETSSTISGGSTPAEQNEQKEPKGKERAVEQSMDTETAVQPASAAGAPAFSEPERKEWVSERQHGSFERTFRFPERIDGASVRASLRNGVLSITIPRAPAHQVRHVTIQ